jgi:hypothetical protein
MKYRFLAGLGLLVAAAVAMYAYEKYFQPTEVIKVTGYIGGSKVNLLKDAEVTKLLGSKYGLEVHYTLMSSHEQLHEIPPPYDFLWPGTEIEIDAYRKAHGAQAKYGSLLLSPMVLYSWQPIVDAFVKVGLVEKRADGVYYAPLDRLVPVLLDQKTPWPQGESAGPHVAVFTTDPVQANSGEFFAALLAKERQQQRGGTFDESFGEVKAYFDSLGYKPPITLDLFKQCVAKGQGACPIFAAYESQLPDFVEAEHLECKALGSLQLIYLTPTVWVTHPLIAVTPAGEKLLQALRDPEIQRIAVEKYGFRSVLGQLHGAPCFPVATNVVTLPLPTEPEMNRLNEYLAR